MTRTTPRTDAEHQLVRLNPAPSQWDEPLPEAAEQDLYRILDLPHGEHTSRGGSRLGVVRRHPGRTGLIATAAAVIVALALVVTPNVLTDSVARAATPPLLEPEHPPVQQGAQDLLRQIAVRVDQLPDVPETASSTAVVNTRSWNLWTRVDGERVTSHVVPAHTKKIVHADGTVKTTTTYSMPDGSTKTMEITTNHGGVFPGVHLGELSSDLDTLSSQLVSDYSQQGSAGRLEAIAQAYRYMPIQPSVRAALLRYLANTPGIATVGEVTDRIGRQGIGFTITSDYSGLATRYMLIIDPQTGRVLDYEATLIKDAGKLNVPIPSVISYTVFKEAHYVHQAGPAEGS